MFCVINETNTVNAPKDHFQYSLFSFTMIVIFNTLQICIFVFPLVKCIHFTSLS